MYEGTVWASESEIGFTKSRVRPEIYVLVLVARIDCVGNVLRKKIIIGKQLAKTICRVLQSIETCSRVLGLNFGPMIFMNLFSKFF